MTNHCGNPIGDTSNSILFLGVKSFFMNNPLLHVHVLCYAFPLLLCLAVQLHKC
jgi:hypothetical protein